MKINLKHYNKDIIYDFSITKNDRDRIWNVILNNDSMAKLSNLEYCYCSELNNNLLSWYNFEHSDDVLEIGTEFGINTEFLCERFKKVDSIAFQKCDLDYLQKKLSRYDNLTLYFGSVNSFKTIKKYDYIILLGMLDNYKYIYGKSVDGYINYLVNLLKPDGKILLATNNKIGVKYLCGASRQYTNISMNDSNTSNIVGFNKKEIENILQRNNLYNYKFYYPLPDYKMTNVIYSDEYLPNEEDNKLLYYLNYREKDNIIYDELNLLKEIVKNNNFSTFSNSFFIEIYNNSKENFSPNIKFVGFNNLRKKKYRMITKYIDGKFIKKPYYSCESSHFDVFKKNIEILKSLGIPTLDSVEKDEICSKFCSYQLFFLFMIDLIKNYKLDIFYEYIKKWKENVISRLETSNESTIFEEYNISIPDNIISNLSYTNAGLYDLVFENAFIDEKDNFYIFDQEWNISGIPVEFILYRSLNNLYKYGPFVDNILPQNELMKELGLSEYVCYFKELEKKIQDSIIDRPLVERFFIKKSNYVNIKGNIKEIKDLKENIHDLNTDIDELKNNLETLNSKMQEVENKNNELSEELFNIQNSNSWKMLNTMKRFFKK